MRYVRPCAVALFAAAVFPAWSAASDLVISEVVEGTASNFKYVEILNRGGTTVNLAADAVVLRRYTNGATSPTNISLTGTIAPGARYVIANNATDITTYLPGKVANQTSTNISHNGNDSYDLAYGAGPTLIDAFAFDNVTGVAPPNYAADMVAFRVLSALPNDGDWGSTSTPTDNTACTSGFWHVRTITASNANAGSVTTFQAGGGAGGEVPVTISGFELE